MKKKVGLCNILFLVVMHMHGMDLINDLKEVVNSPEAQQAEHTVINMVTSPEGQHVLGETKNFVVEKISNLVSGNSDSQNNADRNEANTRSQVPNLNLGSSLPPKRYPSTTIAKKPITKTTDLSKNIKIAQTARTPIPTSRAMDINNSQDTIINMTTVPTRFVPSVSSSQENNNTVVARTYSEEDVWDMLSIANPVLYNFAAEHDLSLDETLLYGELKSKLDISPDAVVDFVKSRLPDNKKVVDWNQPEKYKKLQTKDPQKYKEIIYEMMKAVRDEEDGQAKSSPLADTHIQLAEKQIAGQDGTIKKQWIGLAATLISGIGMLAWAIYGQITAHTTAPTNAPTTFPTGVPT